MIPLFPEFKPLDLEMQEALTSYFRAHPPDVSELTFTNLFAWSGSYGFHISALQEGFLLLSRNEHGMAFFQPLVSENHVNAARQALGYLDEQGEQPRIIRVGESFRSCAGGLSDLCEIQEDRDNFDYLYHTAELVELPGRAFHDKKNLYSQFVKKYDFHYRPLQVEDIERCLLFEHEWCETRECEKVEGLSKERCAIHRILNNYGRLGVKGGVLEVEEGIVGVILGEVLNRSTFVIHIEKAKSTLKGCYQALEVEFLKAEAGAWPFTNKEQDLGQEGLRRAKLSYNPSGMVKKYILTPRS